MNIRECTRSIEFRATDGETNDGHTLEGYAAVFGQKTEINSWEGRFNETMQEGCFRKTLKERTPVMQFDHGRDARTGSVPIGAFDVLREESHGLYCKARMFDNPVVEPIRQAIEGGAITGMSFRFTVVRDEWRDNAGKLVRGDEIMRLLYEPGTRGPLERTIKEVRLSEAGPVVFPAYAGTSVGVRSAADLTEEERKQIVADHQRTMAEAEAEEIRSWLDAETEYREQLEEWLTAETEYREAVVQWLAVETATIQDGKSDSAARKGTRSGKQPEDAAQQSTSLREPSKKDTDLERSRVPEPKAKVMNLEELRARLIEIAERATELGEEFRDAEMPEESQKEFDGLTAEAASLRAKEEKILERAKALDEFASNPVNTRSGSDRGTPAFHKKDDIFDLDSLRSASTEELRTRALKANEGARFSQTADKTRSQERIEGLLEYSDNERGELAQRLILTGSPVYERAFGKAVRAVSTAGLTGEEARALALGVDANGGYAVPFQLDPTVMLQNAGTINPLRRLARHVEIVGKEWQGVVSAGISVTRDVEGAQAADNSPTFSQKVVRTNRVHGFVPFSIELDQDWGQLRSEISTMLADAKEREEATSFTLGDGTGVNANGIITTMAAGSATQTTTGSTGAGVFAAADIYKLEGSLPARYRTPNAAWLANHSTYNAIRQFGTTDGHMLWERIGAGMPSKLLGYDAYEASDMAPSSTLTAGTRFLLFGDFSNFIIVDRIGMQVELVPQLFGANQRPTGQRGIYAIWRNNTKILNDDAFRILKAV